MINQKNVLKIYREENMLWLKKKLENIILKMAKRKKKVALLNGIMHTLRILKIEKLHG